MAVKRRELPKRVLKERTDLDEVRERKTSLRGTLETLERSRKELPSLSVNWERRAEQREKNKRVERTLLAKEKTWIQEEAKKNEETQSATEEKAQLQVHCLG